MGQLLVHLRALWSQLVPAYRDSGSTPLSILVNLLVSPTLLMNAINAILLGTQRCSLVDNYWQLCSSLPAILL